MVVEFRRVIVKSFYRNAQDIFVCCFIIQLSKKNVQKCEESYLEFIRILLLHSSSIKYFEKNTTYTLPRPCCR